MTIRTVAVSELLQHWFIQFVKRDNFRMKGFVLLELVAGVLSKAHLPQKPLDLTTPVQRRIAIHGPNSESVGHAVIVIKTDE